MIEEATITPKATKRITPLHFQDFKKAVAWRNALSDYEAKFLQQVDALVATAKPGIALKITVSDEDRDTFNACLSYVLLGLNWYQEFAFNDDFTVMKRLVPLPARESKPEPKPENVTKPR